MIALDSHPGVTTERLEQVGGKAAVLEALVKVAPDLPIPRFRIVEKNEDYFLPRKPIVRASSVLDFLGGYGVFNTLVNVNRISDAVAEVRGGIDSELARELASRRGYKLVPNVTPWSEPL